MRYRLRTLLIVLAIGLAVLTAAWLLGDASTAVEFARMFAWAATFATLALIAVRVFLVFNRS
jgi:hypothetical protein